MSSRIRNYGIAVLTTFMAWGVDILLEERFSESSGGLYVAAALASTWIGGWGPGLMAVGLTIGLNLAFFDHPYLSLAVGVHGADTLHHCGPGRQRPCRTCPKKPARVARFEFAARG